MEHDIQGITEKNFDGVIGKFRDYSVSALWFYKDDNADDKKLLDAYNQVGKEMKGMAKVCAINCNDWPNFCKKNNDSWLTSDASKPKILVFSNKKTPPTILKALSSNTVFKRTAKFGFVTEDEADVCSKFKVKKFPSVVMQRRSGTELKKDTYSGEMNFRALQEWVNPYVESGVGDKVGAGAAQESEANLEDDQPWLSQEVPELTSKSANSICFKGEGLCVIYLKDGATDQKEIDMLSGLSKKFTSQLSDRA